MNTLRPVGEVTKSIANAVNTSQGKAICLDEFIETDRQHTKEVLVGRLRGMKKEWETATPMNPDYDEAHNQAIDQALQLIEETFKSDND